MSLKVAKCKRYLERVLVLIPPSHEKYDASHVSIVFFCVLALAVMKQPLDRAALEKYIDGLWVGHGYKGSVSYLSTGAEAHLTSTYFCLIMRRVLGLPRLTDDDAASVLRFVESCQLPTGQFKATAHFMSEPSLRHTYSAHAIVQLLGVTGPAWMSRSCEYVLNCQNYDGGFGDRPLDESHAGLTYCALASLSIAGSLDKVHPRIANYLGKRQLVGGGHNGRPNKPADVCYSFWVTGSMLVLGIQPTQENTRASVGFILGSAVDELIGGFVKTPGEDSDPYHTCLALFTLSLLDYPDLEAVDPVLACPETDM